MVKKTEKKGARWLRAASHWGNVGYIWLAALGLAVAMPAKAQLGSNSCSLASSVTWTNEAGSQTFQYTVNLSATVPPYVSAASGAVYPLSSTITGNVQLTDASGGMVGDGVVFFGQGGTAVQVSVLTIDTKARPAEFAERFGEAQWAACSSWGILISTLRKCQ